MSKAIDVIIRYMETDKDHIHYMIETELTMSVSKIVNLDEELYNIPYMEKISSIFTKTILEKEHTFWRDGYFCM